jgi:plasmid stabilization system protein ParE
MMRRIVWAPDSLRDVDEQLAFIAAGDEQAAELMRQRIDNAVSILAGRPIGRPGRVTGAFEKRVLRTRLIVAYRLRGEELQITRVIHSSRDWPAGGWPVD